MRVYVKTGVPYDGLRPVYFAVGQMMQDAVFSCGSRTDAGGPFQQTARDSLGDGWSEHERAVRQTRTSEQPNATRFV